jgi:hypothetical protein
MDILTRQNVCLTSLLAWAIVSSIWVTAQSKTARPHVTFTAAQKWVDLSYDHGDVPSALKGYRVALEIPPTVVWLGLTATSYQHVLFQTNFEYLSCLAATCAIQQGHLEVAVELLDLGRVLKPNDLPILEMAVKTRKPRGVATTRRSVLYFWPDG